MADLTLPYFGPIVSRAEAKTLGAKRYFLGSELPCVHGHIAERYVHNGACVPCDLARTRAWKAANKEKMAATQHQNYLANIEARRAYGRKWRAKNKEIIAIKIREWRMNNPDRLKQHSKTDYEKHRDRRILQRRLYYLKNRDKHAELGRLWAQRNAAVAREIKRRYAKAHPEVGREKARRRRARRRNTIAMFTEKEVVALFEKQKGKCACCFCRIYKKSMNRDHIIPLSKGGSDHISNIQLTCPTCNRKKGALDPFEFAQRNGRLL